MESKMEITIETITPAVAKSYLEGNKENRPIKPSHLSNLARDMAAGNWRLNGDAIRFNGDGTLLDGQHRLAACIKAGVPIETIVIRGIDHEARLTMDAGSRRRAGDQMALMGIKSANTIAAACGYCMTLQAGSCSVKDFTIPEVITFYEENLAIADHVTRLTRGPRGTHSLAVAMSYVLSRTSSDLVEPFRLAWVDGYGERGSPFLVLRERIIRASMAGKPLLTREKVAGAAWALTKAIRGETATILRASDTFKVPGWTA
jgi:hypothetical protein